MPLKLFISYSHEDTEQLDELLKALRPLELDGLIAPWTDQVIDVGEDWRDKIRSALDDCNLGLFLLSMPFLASDFIRAEELKPLLSRAPSDGVRLVPILLRACDWTNSVLGDLQPLPCWDRYIENTTNPHQRDEAWLAVTQKIRQWATVTAAQEQSITWDGIPYPGLRAFAESEARIFMGRDDKTEALLSKLEQGVRFLAVYGASGSGKSSLVRAGLIPAWRRVATNGEAPVLVFKPDELGDGNPFLPLGIALQPFLGPGTNAAGLAQALRDDPGSIHGHIDMALRGSPKSAELLLVVDQFEELFTTVEAAHRQPFAILLGRVLAHPCARLVITVRSDFFHHLEDYAELTDWLNQGNGHFLVRPLRPEHYQALIDGPAKLAGFSFEPGLVDHILAEAEQGANREGLVPLLEFALAKLYEPFGERQRRDDTLTPEERCFSLDAYLAFGGIEGAVGAAANDAVSEVEGAKEVLPRLFRALVSISMEQRPTRRRTTRTELETDPICATLIQRLVGDPQHARLLVADDTHVEVAHEILFTAWQDMADWIAEFKNDLHLRDRMSFEARQWELGGRRDPHCLWSHERQQPLYSALECLDQPRESWTEEPEKSFLRPEADRLLDEIADPQTDHQRRDWIGARWAAIGDPRPGLGIDKESGLPQILWSEAIAPGEVDLDNDAGHFVIDHPFRVSVYPVTRDQYTTFLDAGDEGYDNDRWLQGGLKLPSPRWLPTGAGGNYPVGLVTWNEAMAYCRWLDHCLRGWDQIPQGQQIRLLTEWEWQLAATDGDRNREFPWPGPWDHTKLNSEESGLMRTTAVGLYPAGAAPCSALDMAGNSWEWCLNKYERPRDTALGGEDSRVVRGGSWIDSRDYCRAAYRFWGGPVNRSVRLGFRLCLSSPIVDD